LYLHPLKTKSKRIVHIEIQLQVAPELKERIVFYGSKLITEQIGSGKDFDIIKKVISIIITDEELIEASPRYRHRFTFYDRESDVELSDLMEIHTLELTKLPKDTDGTPLYDWARFIAAESEEELNMIAERNPQIGKAVVKYRELTADERARDLYDRRMRAKWDEQARLRGVKIDIAKNLLSVGDSVEKISKATGLTHEEVENLRT